MPGIHFYGRLRSLDQTTIYRLEENMHKMKHFSGYTGTTHLASKNYYVCSTEYCEYPIFKFETKTYLFVLEGLIYDVSKDDFPRELERIANQVFSMDTNGEDKIMGPSDRDGDFIILIYNKTKNEIAILNDALGRLPFYYYDGGNEFCASREIKWITAWKKEIPIDPIGIGQLFLFRYNLGKHTLLKGVERLPPGSMIRIKFDQERTRVNIYHQWKFYEAEPESDKATEDLDLLIDLLVKGLENRLRHFNGYETILSLSGGLDSRTAMAALKRFDTQNVRLSSATYVDFERISEKEAQIASQVANILGIRHSVFHLDKVTFPEIVELIHLKDGMNYAEMAFILDFFQKLKNEYGNKILYITGDGGDKTLPPLYPCKRIKTAEQLYAMVTSINSFFSFSEIQKFLVIDMGEFRSHLKNHFMSYPEENFLNNYVHFMIFERGMRWLFEGEDRNRFFFWSITPFYSLPFFQYAMSIPEKRKTDYRFYKAFLEKLHPEITRMTSTNWNIFLGSLWMGFLLKGTTFVKKHQYLKELARKFILKLDISFEKERVENRLLEIVQDKLISNEKFSRYFNLENMINWLKSPNINKSKFYILATLVLYLDSIDQT